MSDSQQPSQYGLKPLLARNPAEHHRAASPLELFYDLTFCVACGVISVQVADGIVAGHSWMIAIGLMSSTLAAFWAWVEFSWLSSEFDNDDWLFRALTLLQIIGIVVLAIGIPDMFESLVDGHTLSAGVMVLGYVIMRIGAVAHWLRVASHNPEWRKVAIHHVLNVGVVQAAWVAWSFIPLPFMPALITLWVLWVVDLVSPVVISRISTLNGVVSMPWHAHHMVERYGLIVIIALGETLISTAGSAHQLSHEHGWTFETIGFISIAVTISFSLWWCYFLMPSAEVLAEQRDKVLPWAYGHLPLLCSIIGLGGGLHAVGHLHGDESTVTVTAAVVVGIPVVAFLFFLMCIHGWLINSVVLSMARVASVAISVAGIVVALCGWPLWACLLCISCGPFLAVISSESWDRRILLPSD